MARVVIVQKGVSSLKRKEAGWEVGSSASRVRAPGFETQHRTNQVWWPRPVISAFKRWRGGVRSSRSFSTKLQVQGEFELCETLS